MIILLFGATGAAGGAVLRGCLASNDVTEVRAVTRRPLKITDPKLKVVLHDDYLDFTKIADAFAGVDACLYCLGVSSTQVSGAEYAKISHDMPLAAARMLHAKSPKALFHYITGAGTNEQGRMQWSKVKGRTERELIEQFGGVNWRPAIIGGDKSDHGPKAYQLARPLFRLFKPFRSMFIDGPDLGRAMLQATKEGMRGRNIDQKEIHTIVDRATV